jgi:hypothetical protein
MTKEQILEYFERNPKHCYFGTYQLIAKERNQVEALNASPIILEIFKEYTKFLEENPNGTFESFKQRQGRS